jgi:hypothetical protein
VGEYLRYIPNTVEPGHRGDDTWPDTFTVAASLAARPTTFKPLIAIWPGYRHPANFASARPRSISSARAGSWSTSSAVWTRCVVRRRLLKLFLDRFGAGALTGITAVPLLLGGDWRHSLAPEVFLKPVLAELGASVRTRGLFLLDSDPTGSTLNEWLDAARRQIPVRLLSAVTPMEAPE